MSSGSSNRHLFHNDISGSSQISHKNSSKNIVQYNRSTHNNHDKNNAPDNNNNCDTNISTRDRIPTCSNLFYSNQTNAFVSSTDSYIPINITKSSIQCKTPTIESVISSTQRNENARTIGHLQKDTETKNYTKDPRKPKFFNQLISVASYSAPNLTCGQKETTNVTNDAHVTDQHSLPDNIIYVIAPKATAALEDNVQEEERIPKQTQEICSEGAEEANFQGVEVGKHPQEQTVSLSKEATVGDTTVTTLPTTSCSSSSLAKGSSLSRDVNYKTSCGTSLESFVAVTERIDSNSISSLLTNNNPQQQTQTDTNAGRTTSGLLPKRATDSAKAAQQQQDSSFCLNLQPTGISGRSLLSLENNGSGQFIRGSSEPKKQNNVDSSTLWPNPQSRDINCSKSVDNKKSSFLFKLVSSLVVPSAIRIPAVTGGITERSISNNHRAKELKEENLQLQQEVQKEGCIASPEEALCNPQPYLTYENTSTNSSSLGFQKENEEPIQTRTQQQQPQLLIRTHQSFLSNPKVKKPSCSSEAKISVQPKRNEGVVEPLIASNQSKLEQEILVSCNTSSSSQKNLITMGTQTNTRLLKFPPNAKQPDGSTTVPLKHRSTTTATAASNVSANSMNGASSTVVEPRITQLPMNHHHQQHIPPSHQHIAQAHVQTNNHGSANVIPTTGATTQVHFPSATASGMANDKLTSGPSAAKQPQIKQQLQRLNGTATNNNRTSIQQQQTNGMIVSQTVAYRNGTAGVATIGNVQQHPHQQQQHIAQHRHVQQQQQRIAGGAPQNNNARHNNMAQQQHHHQHRIQSQQTMQQHISVGGGNAGNNNNNSGFATSSTKSQQHLQQHHAQHPLPPKPLFERLDNNNEQELKSYAQIMDTQNRRLVELEHIHDDLENRLENVTKQRLMMEAQMEELNLGWGRRYRLLEQENDGWKRALGDLEVRNQRLLEQQQRKDKEIQRMIQRKYDTNSAGLHNTSVSNAAAKRSAESNSCSSQPQRQQQISLQSSPPLQSQNNSQQQPFLLCGNRSRSRSNSGSHCNGTGPHNSSSSQANTIKSNRVGNNNKHGNINKKQLISPHEILKTMSVSGEEVKQRHASSSLLDFFGM
eukprot:CAMPEP_0194399598 /NCGR_PEP_ID=MMETSP0174-20130528/126749_1 /TAXON_ID=216777 /ORGANISM="Proboscia alata, Strain PI-D3" /LENGTH=1099 /DNA_ID=CAMNT_0039196023 /DNA_START=281 /DNA_END=3580 /DNA_ORIENTATION=-